MFTRVTSPFGENYEKALVGTNITPKQFHVTFVRWASPKNFEGTCVLRRHNPHNDPSLVKVPVGVPHALRLNGDHREGGRKTQCTFGRIVPSHFSFGGCLKSSEERSPSHATPPHLGLSRVPVHIVFVRRLTFLLLCECVLFTPPVSKHMMC